MGNCYYSETFETALESVIKSTFVSESYNYYLSTATKIDLSSLSYDEKYTLACESFLVKDSPYLNKPENLFLLFIKKKQFNCIELLIFVFPYLDHEDELFLDFYNIVKMTQQEDSPKITRNALETVIATFVSLHTKAVLPLTERIITNDEFYKMDKLFSNRNISKFSLILITSGELNSSLSEDIPKKETFTFQQFKCDYSCLKSVLADSSKLRSQMLNFLNFD